MWAWVVAFVVVLVGAAAYFVRAVSKTRKIREEDVVGQIVSLHLAQRSSALAFKVENMGISMLDPSLGMINTRFISFRANLLSEMSFKKIQEKGFRFSRELERISFSANVFTQLPDCLKDVSPTLTWVDFNENCLCRLDGSILEHLSSLTILNLDINRLRQLPPEIGNLVQLKRLDVSSNLLEELPEEIGYLTNLERLNLERNKIRRLPEAFGGLTSLTSLNLSHNSLTLVNQSFSLLEGLYWLNMSYNKMKNVDPVFMGKKEKLYFLDLSSNRIKSLPDLSSIRNLTRFLLSLNPIQNLPGSMASLVSLNELRLDNTHIDDVTVISKLPHLEILSLRNTKITHIPTDFNTQELTQFDLKCNPELVSVPFNIISNFLISLHHDTPLSILPRVFLGTPETIKSETILKEFAITAIINFSEHLPEYPEKIKYHNVSQKSSSAYTSATATPQPIKYFNFRRNEVEEKAQEAVHLLHQRKVEEAYEWMKEMLLGSEEGVVLVSGQEDPKNPRIQYFGIVVAYMMERESMQIHQADRHLHSSGFRGHMNEYTLHWLASLNSNKHIL